MFASLRQTPVRLDPWALLLGVVDAICSSAAQVTKHFTPSGQPLFA